MPKTLPWLIVLITCLFVQAFANECDLNEEAIDVRFLTRLDAPPANLHPELREIASSLERQQIEFAFVQNEAGVVALEIVGSTHSEINRIWQGVSRNNANLKFIFYPDVGYGGRGYYHSDGHFVRISGELLKVLRYDPLAFDTMLHEIYHGKMAVEKRQGAYNPYHPRLQVKTQAPYARAQENYRDLFVYEEYFTWKRGAQFHFNQSLALAKAGDLYSFSQSVKYFEMRMENLNVFYEYYTNVWPLIKTVQPQIKQTTSGQVAEYHYQNEAFDFTLEVPLLRLGSRAASPAELLAATEAQLSKDQQAMQRLQTIYQAFTKASSVEEKAQIIQQL